jgi:hypothetical protein
MPPKKQSRTKAVSGPRQTTLDLKSIKPTSTEVECDPCASNLTGLNWFALNTVSWNQTTFVLVLLALMHLFRLVKVRAYRCRKKESVCRGLKRSVDLESMQNVTRFPPTGSKEKGRTDPHR